MKLATVLLSLYLTVTSCTSLPTFVPKVINKKGQMVEEEGRMLFNPIERIEKGGAIISKENFVTVRWMMERGKRVGDK